MNIKFDESNIPGWYKKLFFLSLLPLLAWPIVYIGCSFSLGLDELDISSDEYLAQLTAKGNIIFLYPVYLLIANFIVYILLGIRVNKYAALLGYLFPVLAIFAGLKYIDNAPLPRSWLTREDPRLFYDTPAYDLAKAIVDDDSVEITKILNESPDLVNYTADLVNYHRDSYKENMLFFAFFNNKFRPLRILISKGANLNSLNYDGGNDNATLLHLLCRGEPLADYMPEEYLSMIKLLLSKGAKVDIVTQKFKGAECIEYECRTPLQELCQNGPDSPEVAKLLLDHGADINRKEILHYDDVPEVHTVFCDACGGGNFKIAEYLLTRGAKKDSTSIKYLLDEKQILEASIKKNSDCAKDDKVTLKIVNRILEYK